MGAACQPGDLHATPGRAGPWRSHSGRRGCVARMPP